MANSVDPDQTAPQVITCYLSLAKRPNSVLLLGIYRKFHVFNPFLLNGLFYHCPLNQSISNSRVSV